MATEVDPMAVEPTSDVPLVGSRQFTYGNPAAFTWKNNGYTCEEGKYCYCGEDRVPGNPMLRCRQCLQWFHTQCVSVKDPVPLELDVGLQFTCACCSPQEVIERVPLNWYEIVLVAMFNLSYQYAGRKEFDFTKEICPFVEKYWDVLCIGKPSTEKLAGQVRKVLNKRPLFEFVVLHPNLWYLTEAYPWPLLQARTGKGAPAKKPTVVTKRKMGELEEPELVSLQPLVDPMPSDVMILDGRVLLLRTPPPPSRSKVTLWKDILCAPQITQITANSCRNLNGYRLARATHGVREGVWYFEVSIDLRSGMGVGSGKGQTSDKELVKPHTRVGWSTYQADDQGHVGFDAYGYGYRDIDGTTTHKAKRSAYGTPYGHDDVIGCLISLPMLPVPTPVPDPIASDAATSPAPPSAASDAVAMCVPSSDPASATAVPAVAPDTAADVEPIPAVTPMDVDSTESAGLESTAAAAAVVATAAAVEATPKKEIKLVPSPGAFIQFYCNGVSQGVAFTDIYEGRYYPSVSCYGGAYCNVNFGEKGFRYPPKDIAFRPICELAPEPELGPEALAAQPAPTVIQAPKQKARRGRHGTSRAGGANTPQMNVHVEMPANVTAEQCGEVVNSAFVQVARATGLSTRVQILQNHQLILESERKAALEKRAAGVDVTAYLAQKEASLIDVQQQNNAAEQEAAAILRVLEDDFHKQFALLYPPVQPLEPVKSEQSVAAAPSATPGISLTLTSAAAADAAMAFATAASAPPPVSVSPLQLPSSAVPSAAAPPPPAAAGVVPHLQLPVTSLSDPASRSPHKVTFPFKLAAVVQGTAQGTIGWSEDGSTVVIPDVKLFEAQLPHLEFTFKPRWKTMKQLCEMFEFVCVEQRSGATLSHPLFRRDQPQLLSQIKSVKKQPHAD